jgi:PAS domain S-box-containing protein
VPTLADWCVVDLVDAEGRLQPVGIAHQDPQKVELARRLRELHPPDPQKPEGAQSVAASGRTLFHPEITESLLRTAARDDEHLALLRALGVTASISVPMRVGERTLGVLSLAATGERRYEAADVELAEEVGRRAAIAVETAQLYRELTRFRTTLDASLDGVFVFDPITLRFSYANLGAASSLGYERDELLGMTPLDLKVEFDESRFRALIEPLLQGRSPSVTFTTTHRHRSGALVPVEVLLQYVAPENEPPRMVMIARDITDRVEAQARLQRLAQSERALSAELRAIIRAMGDAVLVFGPDGRMLFANPAAETLFPGAAIERFEDLRRRMADPGAVPPPGVRDAAGPIEVRTQEDEERWLEISAYPVLATGDAVSDPDREDRVETILFMRDVTEARLARLARDAFIGVLSHELRTPVTTIYGNSKLLERIERGRSAELRREVFTDIETEAERLYRLVEDLLVLARFGDEGRTGDLGREPLLLQRIVPAVISSEEGRWPETRFEVDLEAGLPPAQGDQTYVEQVVRNLVNNAAKYGGAESVVGVEVRSTPDEVRVSVLDEGPGFPSDEAGRLFDLFYRSPHTAGRASGAGIGLFVCRRLIEAMDGRIWARPRPAGGSEFGFALKVFSEEEA